MSKPTPEFQLQFLKNVQRLLSEGLVTSTYKYALLLSIADLCLEKGEDTDAALVLSTSEISEKFVHYYWGHCKPFGRSVLLQNTNRQARVLSLLSPVISNCDESLPQLKRDPRRWQRLVSSVEQTVKDQPLWKLQTVGNTSLEFLYQNLHRGNRIDLLPGVAFCFRNFYGLLTDLIRAEWVRYVRKFNPDVFGTTADLHEFMFGSERASLQKVSGVLLEVFGDICFYCERPLCKAERHIDHFIPWTRYPVDLGHNFVLAHDSCNSAKSDFLAADRHLERWVSDYEQRANDLYEGFTGAKIPAYWQTSVNITRWAYRQTASTQGLTWMRKKEYVNLPEDWESRFDVYRQ